MDEMIEAAPGSISARKVGRPEFHMQERHHWYQVNKFLLDMSRATAELGYGPESMVHLGGTANFYRCLQVFGSEAVSHFRGTHDMDVLSFNYGSVGQTLTRLKHDYALEDKSISSRAERMETRPFGVEHGHPRLKRVEDFAGRFSASLPTKKSIYVEFDVKDQPGMPDGFEMDVYESPDNQIIFNDRIMTKDHLVLDPYEELNLETADGKSRGIVSVPSVRDYFLIKMDIVDYSNSGLRTKDKFDILTTLVISNRLGLPLAHLVEGILKTSNRESAQRKLLAMQALFKDPYKDLQNVRETYPYFPQQEELDQALAIVAQQLRQTH